MADPKIMQYDPIGGAAMARVTQNNNVGESYARLQSPPA